MVETKCDCRFVLSKVWYLAQLRLCRFMQGVQGKSSQHTLQEMQHPKTPRITRNEAV